LWASSRIGAPCARYRLTLSLTDLRLSDQQNSCCLAILYSRHCDCWRLCTAEAGETDLCATCSRLMFLVFPLDVPRSSKRTSAPWHLADVAMRRRLANSGRSVGRVFENRFVRPCRRREREASPRPHKSRDARVRPVWPSRTQIGNANYDVLGQVGHIDIVAEDWPVSWTLCSSEGTIWVSRRPRPDPVARTRLAT
jgi:hypothetical protein